MQKLMLIFTAAILFIFSCKKEESKPKPVVWDPNWCLIEGQVIYSDNDTTHIAFSSNQGYECGAHNIYVDRIIPWASEAYFISSVSHFPGPPFPKVEVKKGVTYYNGITRPGDDEFCDSIRSGYFHIHRDAKPGFEIWLTDSVGRVYNTSELLGFWNEEPTYSYECRVVDYHPFVMGGIQYVKVKMYFNGVQLREVNGWTTAELNNFNYEGYFRNQ